MRFFVTLLMGLCPLLSSAQIADDFSDNDLLLNPLWLGHVDSFLVSPQATLQLQAQSAGTSYLSTLSAFVTPREWEMRVIMEFNPSANNFCKIFLSSDQPNLLEYLNGYYVMLGGTEDEISLYRQRGQEIVKIIDGPNHYLDQNQTDVHLRITLDEDQLWQLWAKPVDSTIYSLMGAAVEEPTAASNYFGLSCTYTATRADKFQFDDVNVMGSPFVDSIPPALVDIRASDSISLQVEFSEALSPHIRKEQFLLLGVGNPLNISQPHAGLMHLVFAQNLKSGTYILEGSELEDLGGNANSFNREFEIRLPQPVELHDLIITEVMADPNPSVGQPDKEYLELYNRSHKLLSLQNLTISDLTKSVLLPNLLLEPQEYLILCPTGGGQAFDPPLRVLELETWPTLNNNADQITLSTPEQSIHFVDYNLDWYDSELKKHGGWSLEMIDFNYPCSGDDNWTVSEDDSGGTPGRTNSIATDNPDLQAPYVVSTYAISHDTILITFDQSLDGASVVNSVVEIVPHLEVKEVLLDDLRNPQIHILLDDTMQLGVIYNLKVTQVADCNGNVVMDDVPAVPVGLPMSADSGDLVINEVLFNPRPLGVTFAELFNRSSKPINVQHWMLARWQGNNLVDAHPLSDVPLMIYPGDHLVFTESPSLLRSHYPMCYATKMIEVSNLPSLPDHQGSLVLLDPSYHLSDQLIYDKSMHHPLLVNLQGISLERISADLASDDQQNWASASETNGFATPGKKNSQLQLTSREILQIIPKVISPMSNGRPQYVQIHYKMKSPSNVIDISIYNSEGVLVSNILNNHIAGTSGIATWDGTDADNQRVPMGYYIISVRNNDRE
ncbi:MAG: lamin tail domain-containing protein, partial [Cyclobacteriaceae bacterium]|nr:lamin tail domain-containing protein [Cyclobacteriaceae bacterium]